MNNTPKSVEGKEGFLARDFIGALHGTPGDVRDEIKTLELTFAPNARAIVTFTGSWNGRLVRSAFNAISKAYRRRRYKHIRLDKKVEQPVVAEKPIGGIGDGR